MHALREPGTVYEIKAHQRSHGVTHQTARDDMFDLVVRGLLTAKKLGRGYRFRAPADLGEKLGKLANLVPLPTDSEDTLPLKLPFRTAHD